MNQIRLQKEIELNKQYLNVLESLLEKQKQEEENKKIYDFARKAHLNTCNEIKNNLKTMKDYEVLKQDFKEMKDDFNHMKENNMFGLGLIVVVLLYLLMN